MSREAAHPDRSTLEAFALGQLETAAMRRVEDHLNLCPTCARVANPCPTTDSSSFCAGARSSPYSWPPSWPRPSSGGAGEPAAVAIDGDKAKATVRKKFQNSDEVSAPKGPVSKRSDNGTGRTK